MRLIDRYATVDSTAQSLAYVVAAGLLGVGIVFGGDTAHPMAILVFSLALIVTVVGFAGPTANVKIDPDWYRRVAFAAVAIQFGLLVGIPPAYFIPETPGFDGSFYVYGNVLAALLGMAAIAFRPRRHAMTLLALLTAIFLLVGAWLILTTVPPRIDVWTFQQIGSAEFLKGNNPYAITSYPDLYGPDSSLYAPGLVKDGFLTFGFSYPPLSLLMALPGYALFGDHRFAQLAAMAAAAWLIATAQPGRLAMLPALLFLFTARHYFVLQQAWTDPFLVLLLAATVWLSLRGRTFAIISLGLTIAVKQHTLVALPLGALLLRAATRQSSWTIAWRASAVAAVITLPFVLWDVAAFIRSTVWLHIVQPFRADSMSYVAWFGSNGEPGLPLWIGFALLVPAMTLAIIRAARTPAGFAASVGFVLLVFFLFSKQSFVHYHYLVIGCLCIAAAANGAGQFAWPTRFVETPVQQFHKGLT